MRKEKLIPIPHPHKEEEPLGSMAEHEQMLVAACHAAGLILMSAGRNRDAQEPLRASTIELLRRLPRVSSE